MSKAERSFEAAWSIVDGLVRSGMRDACVSPGSRSTPIALALSRQPSVHVHVHLDERASAFFALGAAKASVTPVAVACTSGTAVAELFPAVVEASMSRTALVLLTADRPPELRGAGANQTIEQPGIFGGYVRASLDFPVPGDPVAPERWEELLGEALAAAAGPPPGPVHLNLPFREPLVPAAVEPPASVPGTWAPPSTDVDADDVAAFLEAIDGVDRALIVAGSVRVAVPSLSELARRRRWPLLAEPTSGVRAAGALAAGHHLLADAAFLERHVPELVLQVGAAPTSRAGLELARRARRLVILDPDEVVADPHRRSSLTVRGDATALVGSAIAAVPVRSGSETDETAWWRSWHDADAAALGAVDATLDVDDEPFEGRVARDLAASLPDGSTLAVGSSMPVRDLDAYMAPRDGVSVLANRGASGIDGFVSTVLGAAATGAPTTALLGDLTFLYDVGSFLWSARRGHDAVLVVVNNGGGGIFGLLAQKDLPEIDDLFVTPHGLDLGAICSVAGAGHALVSRSSELAAAADTARTAGGVHVVEVGVDRAIGARRRDEVRAAVAAALRSSA
jgi:2-succinyl-5-enolpyruvyl-6-hydroxy-3-cyclohexene-1-carboxylate synthase